jgi:hypothetical protein
MSTYSLSGSGTHSLTADTTGLQVTITTIGAFGGVGRSSPIARYDQGLIRFSDGTSYWPPVPILGGPQFIPVPQNATSIGYALLGGCVVSVTEVIGGTVFFSAGTPSIETLSDVAVSSIADGQVLEWIASASKWENRTPAGSGAGGVTNLLNYVPTTVLASGTSMTSGVWNDFPNTSETFTVTDAGARIRAFVSGGVFLTSANTFQAWARLVLDSTTNIPIAGTIGPNGYMNPLSGVGMVDLGSLSAASHTLKVQIRPNASASLFCDPSGGLDSFRMVVDQVHTP